MQSKHQEKNRHNTTFKFADANTTVHSCTSNKQHAADELLTIERGKQELKIYGECFANKLTAHNC